MFRSLRNTQESLNSEPIVQPPDWNLPFEIMCDASDYAVGVVLGQRVDKRVNDIHDASKTLAVPTQLCYYWKKISSGVCLW